MRCAIPVLLPLLLAVACTNKPPPPPPPPGPQRCQDGMAVPLAPRPPRTVEQLGAWALKAERAARQNERARAACAADYARLREWAASAR